ncbi:hypothetical protein Q5H91_08775 [Sphingomonas sp. KR1UV-12]|uniref:Trypsin n=1 Tax=Sphingomonas aurea TaxID=3063994 RepID=A0ABT9EK36_9SPHN|nr:hypothetical protein [Sphingomonas sp. KR1UV-12]MDP1027304.1 hypothetical protein [Sphingomonas sp. KR1UV-12]
MFRRLMLAALLLFAAPAAAAPVIQTPGDALAQDAAAYAALRSLPLDEALRRLRAQQESVAATDALAAEFRDRLAGIAIEQEPYRIVVLLTGIDPVAPRIVPAGGMTVPVIFRTGALATRAQLVAAIATHQAEIRAALRRPPGIGVDPRSGQLVVMASPADLVAEDAVALADRMAAIAGVPVRIRVIGRPDLEPEQNMAGEVIGGARVIGVSPADGKRYACTTGFAVTDGVRNGVVTAAHCPDELRYVDPAAGDVPLTFEGQWGWGYQDVQLHTTTAAVAPLIYADTAKTVARPVLAVERRDSTRAGDVVCHRGERTGYSCATVELVDFAPAGDLCGGPCTPSWVTVAGPTCQAGDSGAPVFLGTTALGIVKGGSYRADGTCVFYFYMAADYLPVGWSVLTGVPVEKRSIGIPPDAGTQGRGKAGVGAVR